MTAHTEQAERRNTALLAAQTAALIHQSLNTDEVAERLGISESTVRHRKSAAASTRSHDTLEG